MSGNKWAYQVPGKLELPYKYFAGEFDSKFLAALRDSQKIMGARCPKCKKVFIPPRSSCEICFGKIDEWVEIGPKGKITSFCVVNYKEPYMPMEPPYVLALIKLDGADSAFTHLVSEIAPDKVKVGMTVEPVFAEQRKASILDIKYFKPVK
jgi:uncharacterized OB-fold protein